MSRQEAHVNIDQLQQQVNQLVADMQMLEGVLERVLVSPPIMFSMPDGSKRPFHPTRPVSMRTLAMMLKVEEVSQERSHLSNDERRAIFLRDLEEARQEAIAKGIAIEDEHDAAIGD